MQRPKIAVLGASGLIGEAIALDLMRGGADVVAVARAFSAAQINAFGEAALTAEIVSDLQSLDAELRRRDVSVIVNCIGVLQDRGGRETTAAHDMFVAALVACLSAWREAPLLIHLSIPGDAEQDGTPFSQSKRRAEMIIDGCALPSVVLRPGFVIAQNTFGGSALIRALAASPFALHPRDAASPFGVVTAKAISQTVEQLAARFASGERQWKETWDLLDRDIPTVGEVVEVFRRNIGAPVAWLTLPSWVLTLGARLGDFSAYLGWSPPVRSTALNEVRRGVVGDPEPWRTATGIGRETLSEVLAGMPATIQEKWFARLYLLKPMIIGSLALFWTLSGLIAISIAYDEAKAILTTYGFAPFLAGAITVATSLLDIAIGILIAFRRTCRVGLMAGVAVSVFYLGTAAILTPALWVEPLGALVKTLPAIVLMLVALATLESR